MLGFRFWGLGFGVWGWGLRVWDLGFRVITVEGSGFTGKCDPRDPTLYLYFKPYSQAIKKNRDFGPYSKVSQPMTRHQTLLLESKMCS